MGSELSARGGQTLLGNGALGSAHPRTVWAVPVVPISFRTCRRSSIVLLPFTQLRNTLRYDKHAGSCKSIPRGLRSNKQKLSGKL